MSVDMLIKQVKIKILHFAEVEGIHIIIKKVGGGCETRTRGAVTPYSLSRRAP